MSVAAPPSAPPKPLLRGWMHLVCFFLAIPAGVTVIALAQSSRGRAGALVYAVGLVALFGVSGSYHRFGWSDARRLWMQKLDHGTIFLMIAGSYTPVCLMVLDGWVRWTMLAVAWTGALVGFVLAFTGGRASRIVRSTLYIALGWAAVAAIPQMWTHMSIAELVLIAVGGVLFTVGSVFLFTHWPDPFPRVFGYHEVWHVMVVAAVICHFVAITSVVS
jgi:hemolysin III